MFYSTHVLIEEDIVLFAIVMSLVMLISAAMLLYQFWMGSLAEGDAGAPPESAPVRRPDLRRAA
jgi:hypothetical protein